MFEIADENYKHPKTIVHNEKGNSIYFNVIGDQMLKRRKSLRVDTNETDLVPLPADVKVDIEIESGMAYTKEGQKATMQELINTLLQYVEAGAIPAAPVKIAIEK